MLVKHIFYLPYFLLAMVALTHSSLLDDVANIISDAIDTVVDVVDDETTNIVDAVDVLDIIDSNSTYILNFTELATSFGYDSEEHTVVTSDGYVLTIFRLFGRNCSAYAETPVLLMHGLWHSSDTWIIAGPDASLAFQLADACFSIWIGNQRGTTYGRKHITLDPDSDDTFWEFTFDEMGIYDNPAFIDYVLNQTRANGLSYVGYSQSGATFIAMCSALPEYCTGEKVKVFIAQAPAAFLSNMTSTTMKLILQTISTTPEVFINLGYHEIFQRGFFTQTAYSILCSDTLSIVNTLCGAFIDLFDDTTIAPSSNATKELLYYYYPDTSSIWNIVKFNQAVEKGTFTWYDFEDEEKNIARYGSTSPPAYSFENVMVPSVVIRGLGDDLVDYRDVALFSDKLPNLLELIDVSDSTWGHFNFLFHENISTMTYPYVYNYLIKYN